jgi:uridine kinase
MVKIARARDLSQGFVRQRVAGRQPAPIVGLAQLPGHRIPVASLDAAPDVDLTPQWTQRQDVTESDPSLVVAVAPSAAHRLAAAAFDRAHFPAHRREHLRRRRCRVGTTVGGRKTGAVDERLCRYDDLARELLTRHGGVRLVGVDGLGGAGKTTFAARLAHAAGDAPVVHTDDFANWQEPTEWWPRMLTQVVEPLTRGEAASFRPYDWVRRRFGPELVTVPPAPLVVIEGVGATRAAWRDRLVARIWVDTPRDERLRRGLDRDGAHMVDFWTWWMAAEDHYLAEEHPDTYADLRVDGDPSLAHDVEAEFVGLPLRGGSGINEPR